MSNFLDDNLNQSVFFDINYLEVLGNNTFEYCLYHLLENDEIVCKCEQQGKNRIIQALKGPIKLKTTDAVKRRVRAGMGNCQGNRCQLKVKELISDYYDMPIESVKVRTEGEKPKRVSIQELRSLES